MMLIAIGEQVKRLDAAIEQDLAVSHPEIDWKGVKGIRDILSHHYFTIDAEIVFDICQNKIAGVKAAVLDLLADYQSNH